MSPHLYASSTAPGRLKAWEPADLITPFLHTTWGSFWEETQMDSSTIEELTDVFWQLAQKELGFGLFMFKDSFA